MRGSEEDHDVTAMGHVDGILQRSFQWDNHSTCSRPLRIANFWLVYGVHHGHSVSFLMATILEDMSLL